MKHMTMAVTIVVLSTMTAWAAHHPGTDHTATPTATTAGTVVTMDKMVKHEVTTTDKTGTTQQGTVTHTQTTPQHGTRLISHDSYHHHTPSEMALSNDKKWEASLGVGGGVSLAKDNLDARMTDMGLAAGMQMLWRATPHWAFGVDYTMMAPQHRRNYRGGNYNYKDVRAHHLSVAGKYTINAWDKMNFYIPMGVGVSNISMKGAGTRNSVYTSESDNKWGMSLYAGLGMQYNLTNDLFMGLEYRYYLPFIQTDDLNSFGRDRYMDFHSAALRMGMRF